MLSAIDVGCATIAAAVMPAFSRHENWPEGIRASFGAMLGVLASRPALARLLLVDVYTAGDAAIERRNAGLAPLGVLLSNNTTDWGTMPPVVYEAIAGGVRRLMFQEMVKSGPQALPGLAPICAYVTLSPFLGAEKAAAVANGEGGRPAGALASGSWAPVSSERAIPFRAPLRATVWKALSLISEHSLVQEKGGLTPEEISAEVGERVEVVRSYLHELAQGGVIEEEEAGKDEKATEPRYRSVSTLHKFQVVSTQQAEAMSPREREQLSARVWKLIADDSEESMRSGVFDQRTERHLTRAVSLLDEEGWRELLDLHAQMFQATMEIAARSTLRLEGSGEKPIRTRSVQAVFEMPDPEGEEPSE